ncbi:MAG: PHP domain-containing protein, partial [Thermodesulfobacteriota bacterium]
MRIDLHAHTTASDGLLSPEQLIDLARAAGVGILAVADHDSTDSVDRAMAAGARVGIEVLPAVELNTDVPGAEVHLLGYLLDHHVAWFQRLLRRLRDGRLHRAERMVEKLRALGAPVAMERVLALSGGGAVGRPHVARALVEAGWVSETAEAFTRYIGRNGPAYVERLKVTPGEAVQIIRRAGGIPVLA